MAGYTIEKRKASKGELRYRCTIREHKGEEVVYRESRAFGRRSDAKSRRMLRVVMIARDGLPGQVQPAPTIRERIFLYRTQPAISHTIGRIASTRLPLAISPNTAHLSSSPWGHSTTSREVTSLVSGNLYSPHWHFRDHFGLSGPL